MVATPVEVGTLHAGWTHTYTTAPGQAFTVTTSILAIGLLCLVLEVSSPGWSGWLFEGTWQGTFKSQPPRRRSNGAHPEESHKFELQLHRHADKVVGWFRSLDSDSSARQSIQNGKMFGQRVCFDVFDQGEDLRWCVSVRQNRLQGVWSRGPEGGPLLGGMGAGVRLFAVSAERR